MSARRLHWNLLKPFIPIFKNPHLSTIAAHFWPTGLDERRFPVERKLYATEPGVRVLVETQRPQGTPVGGVLMLHGLEGSSAAGYMKSMARAALQAGYRAHRMNLRSCGGTEAYCRTGYHSGLTADLLHVSRQLAEQGGGPLHVVGFSLGGNVALKLAGELGASARGLIAAVAAVSTPIDLAASVARIEERQNRLYEARFVRRLKRRIATLNRRHPELCSLTALSSVRSVREFDERITAPMFGFAGAAEYYSTQSAIRFLHGIRVPALLVQAKDDPVVPFAMFERPEVSRNPCVELRAVDHGGHLGFMARGERGLWCDHTVIEWVLSLRNRAGARTSKAHGV